MSGKKTPKRQQTSSSQNVERPVLHNPIRGLLAVALVMISILSSFVLSQEFSGFPASNSTASNGGGTQPLFSPEGNEPFSEFPDLPPLSDFEPAIPYPGYGFGDENLSLVESSIAPDNKDLDPLQSEKALFHPYSQGNQPIPGPMSAPTNPLAYQSAAPDNRATQVSYNYPNQFNDSTNTNTNTNTNTSTAPPMYDPAAYNNVAYNAPQNSGNYPSPTLAAPNYEQNNEPSFAGQEVFPPSFPDSRLSGLAPELSPTSNNVSLPQSTQVPYNTPLPSTAPTPHGVLQSQNVPPPYIPGPGGASQFHSGSPSSSLDQSQSLNVLASPGTPTTFEGVDQSQMVIDVRVVGYGQIPLDKLRQKVKTRPNRPYSELQVEEDKRALMQTGWFHNVNPNIYKSQDGITITFELVERPLLHYVKFVGNKTFPKSKLLEISMISPGDPLDPMYVYQAKSRIEDFYRESGHHKINVEILSGDRATDRGAVFLVSEGRKQRIDRVTFVGCNSVISGARLKTQIQSKPGILYLIGGEFTREQLDRDVEALTTYYRNLGYFFAKIDRDFSEGRGYCGFGKEDSWVSVRFIIDEGPRCKISRLTINGNRVFTDEQVAAEMKKTKVGEYFNQGGLEMDMRRVKELYGKKGRVFTEVDYDYIVDAPNPNEGVIELMVSVRESRVGQFGEVTVDILDVNGGNAPYTKVATVLNRTPKIRAGRLVDTKEIGDAERRLRYSSIFNSNPAQGYVPELIFELDESQTDEVFEDSVIASEDSGIIRGQYAQGRIINSRESQSQSQSQTQSQPQRPQQTKNVPKNKVPSNETAVRGSMKPNTNASPNTNTSLNANANTNVNADTVDSIRAMIKRDVRNLDSQIEKSTQRDENIIREKQLQRQREQQEQKQQEQERPMLILGQSVRTVPSMPTTTTNGGYAAYSSNNAALNNSTTLNSSTSTSSQGIQPFNSSQNYGGYGSVSSDNVFDTNSATQPSQYATAQYTASPYDTNQYTSTQYTTPQYTTSQYESTQYGSVNDSQTTSGGITPFNPNNYSDNQQQYSNGQQYSGGQQYPNGQQYSGGQNTNGQYSNHLSPAPEVPTSYNGYGNNNYGNNNSQFGFLSPPQPFIPGQNNPSTQGGGIIDSVMPGSAEMQDYNDLLFNPKPQPRIITVPAKFRVQETQTGQFRASVGVNSDAGLVANFLYKEDNFDWRRPPRNPLRLEDWRNSFRGNGEQFKIDLSPGTDVQRYEVAWGNPHFMNTDWSLSLSGFFYSRYYSEWRERRIGGTVGLGYRLTEDLMLSVSYKGESVRVYDPIARGIPDLEKALGTSALHTFGLRLAHDTRDNQHLATEGHLITLSAEQILGTYQYPRLGYDARQYFMLRERPDTSGRWVLGFRSAATWSDNQTPIFERFYAGGFTTLRGFDYRGVSPRFESWMPIGGNFEFYNSVELLFPITADDMIRGVLFVDSGCVQPDIDDWAQKYRVAPGFGVRISIPFMGPAPIAFDFAFPISKDPTDVKNVFTFYVGFMR